MILPFRSHGKLLALTECTRYDEDKMKKLRKLLEGPAKYPLAVSVVVLALFGLGWWLLHDKHIPVLMPSGEIGSQQRDLIIFTVMLAAIVVIPVFVLLTVFSLKYREGNTKATYAPEWSESKKLEIVWWGIPILIIIMLSIVTYVTSHTLDPYRAIKSDKPALEVQVVALQWKWLFIYPEEKIATINDLTIPVDRPVHFSLSADAPMSAFWVPDLGSQIYSMNAMSSQLNLIANRVGTYKGYNTNINGEGYAQMKFDVNVVDDTTFRGWAENTHHQGISLTEGEYSIIAKPNVPERHMYYRLADKDIYEKIIMKYMHGEPTTGSNTQTDSDTMSEMNHDHSHMEGQ